MTRLIRAVSIAALALGLILTPLIALGAIDASSITAWTQQAGGLYKTARSKLADGDKDTLRLNSNGALSSVNDSVADSFWSGYSVSAVNATPTAITVTAGGTTIRHVCAGFQIAAFQDATGTISVAGGLSFRIRDGYVTKWQETISFPAVAGGNIAPVHVNFPVPIVGTANTDMVIEIQSAALAHTGFSINAQGFDIK